MTSLTDRLEARARALRRNLDEQQAPTPRSVLARDIAFVSELLDRTRQIHQEQMGGLRREEFEWEQRLERLGPDDFVTRDRIRGELARLWERRRERQQGYYHELERLHGRLIALFAEYDYLT